MSIEFLYEKYIQHRLVSTDSRKVLPGSVFFALRGENFNGNLYARQALESGAIWAIIDDPAYADLERTTLVDDSLKCLQDLARFHRTKLKIPVIGLTGSNGKTTSKELVHAVLSKKFKTVATKGNLNNHIGVPLTILTIQDDAEMAIIEMGANHVGEIALLSSISMPTHGFITNIGKAHIGTFGGFENIIRGKTELYQFLIEHKGVVFINSANPILSAMIHRFEHPVLYPGKSDSIHITLVNQSPFLEVQSDDGPIISTRLSGVYNFENIAVALCIGKYFGVPPEQSAAAVSGYVPSNMRSQLIEKGSNTIILDAYNANPSSMEAALRNLATAGTKSKVAILGDMYELGDDTIAEHQRIGRLIQELGIDQAIVCGPLMGDAAKVNPAIKHFESKQELISHLTQNPCDQKLILVKASRGMGLETILDYL